MPSCLQMARAVGSAMSLCNGTTVFKDKFDGFTNIGHKFFLGATLRNGFRQLLALAAVKTRYGIMLDDNGVFCHNCISFAISFSQ